MIHSLGAEIEVTDRKLILHYLEDCDYDSLEILEKFYFVKQRPRWNEIEEIFHYSQRAFCQREEQAGKKGCFLALRRYGERAVLSNLNLLLRVCNHKNIIY
jgi:hypothetical protein